MCASSLKTKLEYRLLHVMHNTLEEMQILHGSIQYLVAKQNYETKCMTHLSTLVDAFVDHVQNMENKTY